MRVLIAPQAFKGTLTARQAAEAMADGVRWTVPGATIETCILADGGDGTLDALLAALGGRTMPAKVMGPLGQAVEAGWGVFGEPADGFALVEMAQASGLVLVPDGAWDVMRATTYGTGQLLRAALDARYRHIVVGIGGSATNDGGAGAAQAIGVRLLDAAGAEIAFGAAGLARLARVDVSQRYGPLADARVEVATDVSNPLCGPQGAAVTYGPQKGAAPEQLPLLDAALANMARVVERDLGIAVRDLPGAGAAGGLAAGLVAFCGAVLMPGARLVCDLTRLDERIAHADVVITGEGRVDGQTLFDKTPMEVLRRGRAQGRPVLIIAGSVGPGAHELMAAGAAVIEGAVSQGAPVPRANAAEVALAAATERAMRRAIDRGQVRR